MIEQNLKNDAKIRAYKFALNVIKFIDALNKRDYGVEVMIKQLLRCATSIGANIIEAQAASSRKDFINFLHYALKSANETKFWLGLLKDSGKSAADQTDPLLKECIELSNILGSSLITLKSK